MTDDNAGAHNRSLAPFAVVAVGAVVAFVVALIAFRGDGSKPSSETVTAGNPPVTAANQPVTAAPAAPGCGSGQPDSAYTVTTGSEPSPPAAERTTFHLQVKRDGKAVTGAKVCMVADMTEMHHAGISTEAKEASGGRYDATMTFGMRGPWAGSVVVVEPGKPAVSVPVSFQVG